jgi:zinc transport system substrate-binding protein
MNNKRIWRVGTAVAVVVLLLIGAIVLTKKQVSPTGKTSINVVASYYPLYDFAKNVGGDKVQVTNITPAGSEPHDYEPSPAQLVAADKSDVFIHNGGTMETWVDKFLPDYKHVTVMASNGINLAEGADEETGKPSADIKDPHFWLDPALAEQIVNNIRDGLIKADAKDKDYFTARAKAYNEKLAQLDQEFKTGLASCDSRDAITSHAAFGYLAKRYNLDIVSITGVSPDEEPSTAKLAELTQLVKDKNIKYVFFESLVSPKLAETLAAETGAKTAVFDPIEGISDADQKQGKDYLSVQRENLQNLRTALSCR